MCVTERKVTRARELTKRLMLCVQRNKRTVSMEMLRKFCTVCVSLELYLALARFYTRSMYFKMSRAERGEKEEGRGKEGKGARKGGGKIESEGEKGRGCEWSSAPNLSTSAEP